MKPIFYFSCNICPSPLPPVPIFFFTIIKNKIKIVTGLDKWQHFSQNYSVCEKRKDSPDKKKSNKRLEATLKSPIKENYMLTKEHSSTEVPTKHSSSKTFMDLNL